MDPNIRKLFAEVILSEKIAPGEIHLLQGDLPGRYPELRVVGRIVNIGQPEEAAEPDLDATLVRYLERLTFALERTAPEMPPGFTIHQENGDLWVTLLNSAYGGYHLLITHQRAVLMHGGERVVEVNRMTSIPTQAPLERLWKLCAIVHQTRMQRAIKEITEALNGTPD